MKIYAFSGNNGCGKTTQAKLLLKGLKKRFDPNSIGYIHSSKVLLKKDQEYNSGKNYVYKKRFLSFSFLMLLKDILKIWFYILLNIKKDILIIDRYTYDLIAKFRFNYGDKNIVEKLANLLLPKPMFEFKLLVEPQIGFKRDRDYPISFHIFKGGIYKNLFNENKRGHTIDANQEIEEVAKEILKLVKNE